MKVMAFPGCFRLSLACLSLVAGAAFAQAPSDVFKRPAGNAEAKLRERVTAFFEAQQQGKWRQAEKFVSEDSIDAFLERDKIRFEKFEIHSIQWGKDLQQASVTVTVPMQIDIGAFGKAEAGIRPMVHHWRLEDGDWFWFVPKVDPCAPIETPFGISQPPCKDGQPLTTQEAEAKSVLERMIAANQVNPEELLKRVTTDRREVELNAKAAGDETITITSKFDGPVMLEILGGKITGLSVTFDGETAELPGKLALEANKTATLRFRYAPNPEAPPPAKVGMQIMVEPLRLALPVEIAFR